MDVPDHFQVTGMDGSQPPLRTVALGAKSHLGESCHKIHWLHGLFYSWEISEFGREDPKICGRCQEDKRTPQRLKSLSYRGHHLSME